MVLGEKDIYRKELKALFYFPCMHTVPSWENSVEMFSDDYFAKLKTIHEQLKSIINMDECDFEEFAYNISW